MKNEISKVPRKNKNSKILFKNSTVYFSLNKFIFIIRFIIRIPYKESISFIRRYIQGFRSVVPGSSPGGNTFDAKLKKNYELRLER